MASMTLYEFYKFALGSQYTINRIMMTGTSLSRYDTVSSIYCQHQVQVRCFGGQFPALSADVPRSHGVAQHSCALLVSFVGRDLLAAPMAAFITMKRFGAFFVCVCVCVFPRTTRSSADLTLPSPRSRWAGSRRFPLKTASRRLSSTSGIMTRGLRVFSRVLQRAAWLSSWMYFGVRSVPSMRVFPVVS